jgi:hypothetical protein
MSRRLETVARSSGVLKSKRKRHRDNGIWQKSGAFTELWASTPRPGWLTFCTVRLRPAPIVELRISPKKFFKFQACQMSHALTQETRHASSFCPAFLRRFWNGPQCEIGAARRYLLGEPLQYLPGPWQTSAGLGLRTGYKSIRRSWFHSRERPKCHGRSRFPSVHTIQGTARTPCGRDRQERNPQNEWGAHSWRDSACQRLSITNAEHFCAPRLSTDPDSIFTSMCQDFQPMNAWVWSGSVTPAVSDGAIGASDPCF